MTDTPIKISIFSAYKFILIPLIGLAMIVVLSVVVFNVGKKQMTKQFDSIKILESDVNVLSTKVSILQEEKEILKLYGRPATSVLPNSAPTLLSIYKIKKLAFDSTVTLSDLIVGTALAADEDYSSITIAFKLSGTTDAVISFIDKLQLQSPLTLINKVEIKTSGDISDAEVAALSYFSVLPETLPPITNPITNLTRDEIDTLNGFMVSADDNQFDLEQSETKTLRNPFVF